MRKTISTVMTIFAVFSAGAQAEEITKLGPVSFPRTEQYILFSEEINQRYRIDISLPRGFDPSTKYPVVYFTDSNLIFGMVAGNAAFLQIGREIPPAIFVGIGYEADDAIEIAGVRFRDLTPSNDEERMAGARKSMGVSEDMKGGGAVDFLGFIDRRLKPFIYSKFRIEKSDQTLLGYSLGGLFTLHVLLTSPDSFDKYVAGSPSLWWDDNVLFTIEEDFAENNSELAKRVFISAGELEPQHMSEGAEKMHDVLSERRYSNLRMEYHLFQSESHASGTGTAINRGLRSVFSSGTLAD